MAGHIKPETLKRMCVGLGEWINEAGDADGAVALEALQLAVTATRHSATVTGELPVEPPSLITIGRTSA